MSWVNVVVGQHFQCGKGIRRVEASYDLGRVPTSFDETNVVACAGLLTAAALAARVGFAGLVDRRLYLPVEGANCGVKALTVIGSMLAGGDWIDDTSMPGTAGMSRLFDRTRASSTIGMWCGRSAGPTCAS